MAIRGTYESRFALRVSQWLGISVVKTVPPELANCPIYNRLYTSRYTYIPTYLHT